MFFLSTSTSEKTSTSKNRQAERFNPSTREPAEGLSKVCRISGVLLKYLEGAARAYCCREIRVFLDRATLS